MPSFLSIFSCCVPGRRSADPRHSTSTSETTPLLPSTSSRAGQGASSQHSDPKQSSGPDVIASSTGDQQPTSEAAGTKASATRAAYNSQDLAAITGWARSKYVPLRHPSVLSANPSGTANEKGNAGGPLLEEVEASKGDVGSDVEPDEQLRNLIEKLARGVAFDGWTGQESEDKDRDRDARSESSSDT